MATTTAAPQAAADGRILVEGLARRFGPRVALHPLDLELGPGGVVGLLGPNGSGKSTLLRCLVGLVRPDAGRVVVDGVPLRGEGRAVRERVSYAPGEVHLYRELTGAAHLAWLLRGREPEALGRARRVADDLGLPLRAKVRAYSHGMKRQLLFAAAVAPRLRVRILDEPTEGLDPSKRGAVLEILRAEARAGATILLSSHHLGEVDRVCDRMVFLSEGRLLSQETPATVAARAVRHARIAWDEDADMAAVRRALAALAGVSFELRDHEAVVAIDDPAPRRALAALLSDSALPAPRSLAYGELSLGELYRELYGVEAC